MIKQNYNTTVLVLLGLCLGLVLSHTNLSDKLLENFRKFNKRAGGGRGAGAMGAYSGLKSKLREMFRRCRVNFRN